MSFPPSLTPKNCAKLLYFSTFGPKEEDISEVMKQGYLPWLNQQFELPPTLHQPTVKQYGLFSTVKRPERSNENNRLSVWWQHTLTAPDQVRQRVAHAWSQIFVVSKLGGPNSMLLSSYYDVLIQHGLGNFKTLLKTVTLHPAMGKYLTLNGSRKKNTRRQTFPDENFAREVMQLFTLGLWALDENGEPKLDPSGEFIPAYEQEDIEELARVLTGWRAKKNTLTAMVGTPLRHDDKSKIVLGVAFPAGQSIEADLDQAIELLFQHNNTPFFISHLLLQRLITSNPTLSQIKRIANVFIDNGYGVRGDLKAVISAILLEEDWYQPINNVNKVKEPILVAAQLARALKVTSNHEHRWWFIPMRRISFAQGPLRSPSVFNFYTSDYAPNADWLAESRVAPEFDVWTMDLTRHVSNELWRCVVHFNHRSHRRWNWDRRDYLQALSNTDEYIELLNTRFFGGWMSESLQTALLAFVEEGKKRRYSKQRLIHDSLFALQSSPEFRTMEFYA